jgi:hypothetical protein
MGSLTYSNPRLAPLGSGASAVRSCPVMSSQPCPVAQAALNDVLFMDRLYAVSCDYGHSWTNKYQLPLAWFNTALSRAAPRDV